MTTTSAPNRTEMETARAIPFVSLFVYIALSLADLTLTWILLEYSGGKIYESNPIAGAWLATYGWAGLIIYKTLALALVVIVSVYVSFKQPQTARRLLRFAIVAVGAVTVYSYYLLINHV